MAQGSFTATVKGWASERKERMVAVRREAAQRTIEIMQTPVAKGGNMPVKSGFLRASLKATIGLSNFATMANPNDARPYAYDPAQISLVIAGSNLNDPITVVYTAVYANVANYGGPNREARMFVDLAAQRWTQIVAQVAAEAEARNRK